MQEEHTHSDALALDSSLLVSGSGDARIHSHSCRPVPAGTATGMSAPARRAAYALTHRTNLSGGRQSGPDKRTKSTSQRLYPLPASSPLQPHGHRVTGRHTAAIFNSTCKAIPLLTEESSRKRGVVLPNAIIARDVFTATQEGTRVLINTSAAHIHLSVLLSPGPWLL